MTRRYTRRRVVQGMGAVGLGLLAGCGRWPGQAPQPARTPRVGFLASSAGGASLYRAAFGEGLAELGWVEGQNVVIEDRSPESAPGRVSELATELVALPVDVIVTVNLTNLAASQATNTIPIVMATSGDPISDGLVASLARPGGNVTGLTLISPELSGKRLEILKETVPGLSERVRYLV